MKRFVAILIMGTLSSFIFSPMQVSAQGTWKQLPVTPTKRTENSAALLDGKIYVLGGFTPKGATTRVDVWNPILNNWGMAAPLPQALHHTTAAVVNGKFMSLADSKVDSGNPSTPLMNTIPTCTDGSTKLPCQPHVEHMPPQLSMAKFI